MLSWTNEKNITIFRSKIASFLRLCIICIICCINSHVLIWWTAWHFFCFAPLNQFIFSSLSKLPINQTATYVLLRQIHKTNNTQHRRWSLYFAKICADLDIRCLQKWDIFRLGMTRGNDKEQQEQVFNDKSQIVSFSKKKSSD